MDLGLAGKVAGAPKSARTLAEAGCFAIDTRRREKEKSSDFKGLAVGTGQRTQPQLALAEISLASLPSVIRSSGAMPWRSASSKRSRSGLDVGSAMTSGARCPGLALAARTTSPTAILLGGRTGTNPAPALWARMPA